MSEYLNEKLTVLIIGFDGYVDVWRHSADLLNRFWKNRPRTILANSELRPNYQNIEIVNAGKDAEWSKKAIEALKVIDTEYVLLMLEDFFISAEIENETIANTLRFMDTENIDYCQVLVQAFNQSWVQAKSYKGNKHILAIDSNKKYPINLQAAIWRKSYLQEALGEGNYNAWTFEMNHMYDIVNTDRISCVIDDTNMLHIIHGIVQSKYLRNAKRKLKKLGCNISDDERATLSFKDDFKYNFKLLMYSIVPSGMQNGAKKIGKLFKIDFVTDRLSGEGKRK